LANPFRASATHEDQLQAIFRRRTSMLPVPSAAKAIATADGSGMVTKFGFTSCLDPHSRLL